MSMDSDLRLRIIAKEAAFFVAREAILVRAQELVEADSPLLSMDIIHAFASYCSDLTTSSKTESLLPHIVLEIMKAMELHTQVRGVALDQAELLALAGNGVSVLPRALFSLGYQLSSERVEWEWERFQEAVREASLEDVIRTGI
jgi:hypothetical protein